MATTTFKCPNCGGGLQFNPRSQKSKCEFCLSEFSDAEIVELNNRTTKEVIDNSLKEYSCKSCGAHVVTEETTSATFCYYCHNPVLVTERLAGEFRPSKIIPFTYNKEKAMDSFLRWAKSKKFVPKEFYSTSQLEKITGIYLPYWMADLEANIDYSGKGTNLRVWRVGDKEYTEFKEYKIERQGTIDVDNVHEVALGKIDKGLIDSISPYDESKAIDFSMSYLSGFFAEKYDIEKNQVKPQIEERVRGYATSLIQDTIGNYGKISMDKANMDLSIKEWKYILLPAWILTYNYHGRTYIYAVNGQTGKSYGELPVDNKKLGMTSGAIAGVVFAITLVGGLLVW